MIDLLLIAVIVILLGSALAYIIHAKRNGAKCIGCPASKECSAHAKSEHCSCGCSSCKK